MLTLIVQGHALASLLCDCMSELDLVSCDRNFRGSVMFTYERDDGLCRSWIDHVLCSRSCSTLVSDVFASHSGSNLSDHSPLFFCIRADCQSPSHLSSSESSSPSLSTKIDWSRISVDDVDRYCHMVHHLLPSLPLAVVTCSRSDCSEHLDLLDSFAQSLLSPLVSSSSLCFPCVSPSPPKIPGWNDGTRKLREMSIFWDKVWVEAGCPSAGVLFNIKRNTKSRFKYAVCRLKRRKEYLIRERFASSFTSRKKYQFSCEVRRLNRVRKSIAPCVGGVTGAQHIANLFSSRFESLLNKHPPSSRSVHLSKHLCPVPYMRIYLLLKMRYMMPLDLKSLILLGSSLNI